MKKLRVGKAALVNTGGSRCQDSQVRTSASETRRGNGSMRTKDVPGGLGGWFSFFKNTVEHFSGFASGLSFKGDLS